MLRLTQTYSTPCVTLTDSQHCYILSPGISRTRVIQNPVKLSPAIFRTLSQSEQFILTLFSPVQACSETCVMLAYAETWHIQNPGIPRTLLIISRRMFRTLSYLQNQVNPVYPGNSEPCHIDNSRIFRIVTYLKPNTYSEPS